MTSSSAGPATSAESISPNTANMPQEFIVRAPQNPNRNFSLLRFHSANAVDFTTSKNVYMNRENNLRQYKTAYGIVDMPTTGAGSEFGREQKEEARRKKYGYTRREYRTADQPWVLTVGKGKESRRFKGTREGGISENVTYFVFHRCKDGAFEAHPVSQWYNMNPVINYRYLKEDEAEEEYTRRHKTMNLFNVMVKRRINEDVAGGDGAGGATTTANGRGARADDADDEGGNDLATSDNSGKRKKKTGRKRSSLKLTDMDDWVGSSDEEGGDSGSDGGGADSDKDEAKKKKKGGGAEAGKKKKKKKRGDADSEAMEDSDLDDHDGDEVDYMTHSSSDEEKLSPGEREAIYKEEGVEEETALKALLTDLSSDEDETEDKSDKDKAEEPLDEDEESRGNSKSRINNSSSSNSGSSSSSAEDSDSEIDKKASDKVAYLRRLSSTGGGNTLDGDQSNSATTSANKKRTTAGQDDSSAPPRKKQAVSSATSLPPLPSNSGGSVSSTESQIEALVRKYLLRKPITAPDLLKKIRMKKLVNKSNDCAALLATILKRINPLNHKVNNIKKLYLKV